MVPKNYWYHLEDGRFETRLLPNSLMGRSLPEPIIMIMMMMIIIDGVGDGGDDDDMTMVVVVVIMNK